MGVGETSDWTNPNPELRKKSEVRSPIGWPVRSCRNTQEVRETICHQQRGTLGGQYFGFWISEFFRISALGIRIS